MQYLRLRLGLPHEARHPMHQFLTEGAHVDRSLLRRWNVSSPERVTALFQVVGDVDRGREAYLAALEEVASIRSYDVTVAGPETFYIYIVETASEQARVFYDLLAGTDLLVLPPIEYGPHGEMILEVAGEESAFRTLVADLPDEFSVAVDRLGEYDPRGRSGSGSGSSGPATGSGRPVLTGRQREAVAVARALGYYDVPRRAGVRAVAEALGCSRSTAATHLRKAEARLVEAHGPAPTEP